MRFYSFTARASRPACLTATKPRTFWWWTSGRFRGREACADARSARARGQQAGARGAAALGTITKYPATGMGAGSGATSSIAESGKIEVIDPETGEITAFERSGSGAFVQAKRSFEDGRQARYSLHRAFKQIEPKHRTAQCLWSVVSAEKTVQVMLDQEHNRARYNNLRVCGRVWPCPFCSAKISERRALELAGAMAVAKAKGCGSLCSLAPCPTSFRTA